MVLVDTNVIVDILDNDPNWANWSIHQLNRINRLEPLRINVIVYAELSRFFATPSDLDGSLSSLRIGVEYIPREAAFLAGKAFLQYRKSGGTRTNVLPDFFIGGHAEASACPLITRDARRYTTYFPTVRLITP
ncbi:type II toxin-antitoxin system VapC family toxin [Acidicapsa acidisoli]|uniref:type II toxin-antitoxin system VapC family toxin n=1 Tax=Acidicapsa acidisoli TaxID=1615681 RepID=UPI0021E0BF8F|nr:type II toxin-antitoxin system VapC family toxin [Acidicapsa acidisoli]